MINVSVILKITIDEAHSSMRFVMRTAGGSLLYKFKNHFGNKKAHELNTLV
jgi:hypothetical protein